MSTPPLKRTNTTDKPSPTDINEKIALYLTSKGNSVGCGSKFGSAFGLLYKDQHRKGHATSVLHPVNDPYMIDNLSLLRKARLASSAKKQASFILHEDGEQIKVLNMSYKFVPT
ncbi:hypothetical protein GEMRC1_003824 [Eukaryota sp. GEM-RC1]